MFFGSNYSSIPALQYQIRRRTFSCATCAAKDSERRGSPRGSPAPCSASVPESVVPASAKSKEVTLCHHLKRSSGSRQRSLTSFERSGSWPLSPSRKAGLDRSGATPRSCEVATQAGAQREASYHRRLVSLQNGSGQANGKPNPQVESCYPKVGVT